MISVKANFIAQKEKTFVNLLCQVSTVSDAALKGQEKRAIFSNLTKSCYENNTRFTHTLPYPPQAAELHSPAAIVEGLREKSNTIRTILYFNLKRKLTGFLLPAKPILSQRKRQTVILQGGREYEYT